jgi:hypothetical protein
VSRPDILVGLLVTVKKERSVNDIRIFAHRERRIPTCLHCHYIRSRRHPIDRQRASVLTRVRATATPPSTAAPDTPVRMRIPDPPQRDPSLLVPTPPTEPPQRPLFILDAEATIGQVRRVGVLVREGRQAKEHEERRVPLELEAMRLEDARSQAWEAHTLYW